MAVPVIAARRHSRNCTSNLAVRLTQGRPQDLPLMQGRAAGPDSRDPPAAVRRFVVDQAVAARLDAPDATVPESTP